MKIHTIISFTAIISMLLFVPVNSSAQEDIFLLPGNKSASATIIIQLDECTSLSMSIYGGTANAQFLSMHGAEEFGLIFTWVFKRSLCVSIPFPSLPVSTVTDVNVRNELNVSGSVSDIETSEELSPYVFIDPQARSAGMRNFITLTDSTTGEIDTIEIDVVWEAVGKNQPFQLDSETQIYREAEITGTVLYNGSINLLEMGEISNVVIRSSKKRIDK